MTFSILSWNVAGRVSSQPDQAAALMWVGAPDVICLQEVRKATRKLWLGALGDAGYDVVVASLQPGATGSRRLAVAIAARSSLELVPPLGLPWPERHLAARIRVNGSVAEIHVLHSPLSSKPGQVKARTLESLFAYLSAPTAMPRVLVGDLNTPQYESREGEIQTFARTRSGRLRPQYGERHDRAELALIKGLPELGWKDAFRSLHGYGRRDRSWKVGRHPGYRLDHVIVSPGIRVLSCEYVHELREQGLSDHSAIRAELSLTS